MRAAKRMRVRGIFAAAMMLALVSPGLQLRAQMSQVASQQPPAAAVPPLYGPLGVTPQAVVQGQLGSCYFHATIAAIANRDAGRIKRAIVDAGDGSYVVRLDDGTNETVHLEDVMFARQNRFDVSDGLWVTVLLRGVAQDTLRKALLSSIAATPLSASAKASASQLVSSSDTFLLAYDRAVRSVLYQDGTIDKDVLKTSLKRQAQALSIPAFFSQPVIDFLDAQGFFDALALQIKQNGELFGAYRGVGQGGLPTRILRAFGLMAVNWPLTDEAASRALVARVNEPSVAMVATTGATLRPDLVAKINAREAPSWWVTNHAYTVLGYDAETDRVTLRNPWGRQPAPTGVFSLPMADFLAAFTHIDYSNQRLTSKDMP